MLKDHRRLFGLDILRTVAILLVLIGHSIVILGGFKQESLFANVIGKMVSLTFFFGHFGVEIFFTLSGFLIGTILYKNYIASEKFTLQQSKLFWIKRWFRTLPAYFISLLMVSLLSNTFDYRYLLFIQNFDRPLVGIFGETWSLSIEEWSYLLIPIALIVADLVTKNTNRRSKFKKTITIYIILTLILKITWIFYLSEFIPDADVRGIVMTRLDAIAYGVLGASLIQDESPFLVKNFKTKFWFGVIGLFILYVLARLSAPPFNLDRNLILNIFSRYCLLTFINLCTLLMIPFLISTPFSWNKILKNTITYISKVSYSLYLTHFTIIFVLLFHLDKIHLDSLSVAGMVLTVYWIVCFVVAHLMYHYVEIPFLRIRDRVSTNG